MDIVSIVFIGLAVVLALIGLSIIVYDKIKYGL